MKALRGDGNGSACACARRAALVRIAGAVGALTLHGCAGAPPSRSSAALDFPLSELTPGGRRLLIVAGEPVEVTRDGHGVSARVLVCTHFGCTVSWSEARRAYLCPCHEGAFDPTGRPVAGPPTRALRAIPARILGDRVRLEPVAP